MSSMAGAESIRKMLCSNLGTSLLEMSAREVFEMMLGTSLECSEGERPPRTELTAMVGLAGPICGIVSIRCNADAAAAMASRMLAEPIAPPDARVMDALGEICNMLAGNFKGKVTHLSESCLLSVPTIIRGADYQLHSLLTGSSVERALKFDGYPLWISLEVRD